MSLPAEVCNIVLDMACRKQHNNSPSRYGLIVCIDVDFSKKIEGDLETALQEWVWDSLDRAHRELDFEVPWYFVNNVRHDQWEDDDSDNDEPQHHNCYQICVQIEPDKDSGGPPLLSYAQQHEVKTPVHPEKVLEHFTAPPRDVRGVAISGVNQEVLCDEWSNCIAPMTNTFSRGGKGYMLHPMYTLPEQLQAETLPRMFCQRERSFTFGWPNYPGFPLKE